MLELCGHIIFVLLGLMVFGIIGWGLVEAAIELFTSPPPGMGVVYRTTNLSDAIERAFKKDSDSVRTRPKPENEAEDWSDANSPMADLNEADTD